MIIKTKTDWSLADIVKALLTIRKILCYSNQHLKLFGSAQNANGEDEQVIIEAEDMLPEAEVQRTRGWNPLGAPWTT